MKKLITVVILSLCFFFNIFAQKDLYTAIKEIGTEAVYIQYISLTPTASGTKIENTGKRLRFDIVNNPFGKPWGVDCYDAYDNRPEDKSPSIFFRYDKYQKTDHYTYPSYTKDSRTGDAYAMIDSVLFKFSEISEDGSSFSISCIYLPQVEVNNQNTAKKKSKKKMKLKDRVAAAKNKLTAKMGPPMWNKASKMNLEKVAKNYFKAMKVKQSNHTYTAQELREIQGEKNALVAEDQSIKMYNDSIRATPEYQKMLATRKMLEEKEARDGSGKVTIVNNRSSQINLTTTQGGHTIQINSGSDKKIDCSRDLYFSILKGSTWTRTSTKAYSANSGCDRTISIK